MAVKKENIQCNVTKETLFVGVGGIGSDIVKKVAEKCVGTEADNLRFVVMDTNANDLSEVKKSKAVITHVQTSSTQRVRDYLANDKDACDNWFPVNETLNDKTVSEGAGQVRAISRLALNATIKTGRIQELYNAIDELFLKDGGDLKQALRVVIVSSAAGGTGSGIAMIIGMLIREYLHKNYREKSAIIRGYLVLPGVLDTVISSETERQSLRRNGYATIKEINAFMIKASGYCSMRKELERYKDIHINVPTTTNGVDRLEGLPFDFCFLLDKVDKSQESMQSMDQYKEFAAQSLYEQNIGPMQKSAFGQEDNVIKEFAVGDNLGRNRFGGIGASVLKYPYEDIVKYVANKRALSCIGDGNSVGKWLKYDKAFKQEEAEFKKRSAYTSDEAPEIGEIYISKVNSGGDVFDNSIKRCFAKNVEKPEDEVDDLISAFKDAFDKYIYDGFENNRDVQQIKASASVVKEYCSKLEELPDVGKIQEQKNAVRKYEEIVKHSAEGIARMLAKAAMYDAPSIKGDKIQSYNIESLLVGREGAMHPNAMRYLLYAVNETLKKKQDAAKTEKQKAVKTLSKFAVDAKNSDYFDVDVGFAKKELEENFDQVCDLVGKTDSGFLQQGARKAVLNKIKEIFPAYIKAVNKLCENTLKEASYEVAIKHVTQLSKEFEKFYSSFESKVHLLSKSQEDIASKLKFRDGNNVSYVCGDRRSLERFAEICPTGSDDLMLPAELCADIFEAIKYNAENMRMVGIDATLAKPGKDIFETVLTKYFVDSVSDECDGILNMNIFSAIEKELEFKEYFKAQDNAGEGEIVYIPEISDRDKDAYFRGKFGFGYNLAAPGIGRAGFSESREVRLCAYNNKLSDFNSVDIKAAIQPNKIGAVETNTVSKYEIRFFNALYNVTADAISRFKAPEYNKDCGNKKQSEAGIYYRDYHDYVKKIGPDSQRSAAFSLHTDKRWDSLSELPEISLDAHYNEMVKIHSALIYAVVHSMIVTYQSSRYDARKRIFALEDCTDGDRTALIVSNNTECDEFYEVLDALYRDRASVAKIYSMQKKRCEYDMQKNRRYTESAFVADAKKFKIGDGHDAPTSVFEIPLMYYNSLPRAKLDDSELAIMIDSVISVLEHEIEKYEQVTDRAPFLAERLEEQFELFVKNFLNDDFNKDGAMRKNTVINENRVVNMVYRKVTNKMRDLNVYGVDERIEKLRKLIK